MVLLHCNSNNHNNNDFCQAIKIEDYNNSMLILIKQKLDQQRHNYVYNAQPLPLQGEMSVGQHS